MVAFSSRAREGRATFATLSGSICPVRGSRMPPGTSPGQHPENDTPALRVGFAPSSGALRFFAPSQRPSDEERGQSLEGVWPTAGTGKACSCGFAPPASSSRTVRVYRAEEFFLDSPRRPLVPDHARPHDLGSTLGIRGGGLEFAKTDLPTQKHAICPRCKVLAKLVSAMLQNMTEALQPTAPTSWREKLRHDHMCVLCLWATNPQALLFAALQDWVWFLVAPEDGDKFDATISQEDLTRQWWGVVRGESKRIRDQARLNLITEIAQLAPQGQGGKQGLQNAYEVFSGEDRKFIDRFFSEQFGPLSELCSQERLQAVILNMWGLPLLLMDTSRPGCAKWRGRERIMLTEAGVEALTGWVGVVVQGAEYIEWLPPATPSDLTEPGSSRDSIASAAG